MHLALKWKGCYSKNVRKSREWVGRGARERARGWNVRKKKKDPKKENKTTKTQKQIIRETTKKTQTKQKNKPTPDPLPLHLSKSIFVTKM